MTRDDLADITITTGEEFEAALESIIENAIHEGVDVRGAWEFITHGSTHSWEVEVVELAKEGSEEDDQHLVSSQWFQRNEANPSTEILTHEIGPIDSDSPGLAVVRGVSAASDRRPRNLTPLGETIDVDSLEALYQSVSGNRGSSLEMTFRYEGYLVHIDGGVVVTIYDGSG